MKICFKLHLKFYFKLEKKMVQINSYLRQDTDAIPVKWDILLNDKEFFQTKLFEHLLSHVLS